MTPSPSERIAAIRKRLAYASPAPWDDGDGTAIVRALDGAAVPEVCEAVRLADAEFIAHARDDIPWLLDHIDTLRDLFDGIDDLPIHHRAELLATDEGRDRP